MGWTLSDDVDVFLAAAGGFLRGDPVSNTVALTVLEDMRAHGPGLYGDVLFGWWTRDGRVQGAFLRTGGYPPQLSAMPERAARDLADVLADRGARVAGAGGAKAAAEAAGHAAQKAGAGEVVLFADLANPTSNSVYRRLGYRPVEDRTMLTFTTPTP